MNYYAVSMSIEVENKTHFPERLRKLRIQKGLSQIELSKLAKIHNTHISRYERGESKPTAKYLKFLANALEVSTDYLYDGNEEDAIVADFEDKELLEMFIGIEGFSDEKKKAVKIILSDLIKAEQHHQIENYKSLTHSPTRPSHDC